MAQMGRDLLSELHEAGCHVRYLVRDRDCKFTAAFDALLRAEGTRAVHRPVRAPRAYCCGERWTENLRSECLDHLLVLSRGQVDRVLRAYVGQYNRARPHRGLGLQVPAGTATQFRAGHVERHDVLGGLIHEYRRAA
jgi:transposase InsO family protein